MTDTKIAPVAWWIPKADMLATATKSAKGMAATIAHQDDVIERLNRACDSLITEVNNLRTARVEDAKKWTALVEGNNKLVELKGRQLVAEQVKVQELVKALKDAAESIQHWGDYADEYGKNKWNLKGDIYAAHAVVAKHGGEDIEAPQVRDCGTCKHKGNFVTFDEICPMCNNFYDTRWEPIV